MLAQQEVAFKQNTDRLGEEIQVILDNQQEESGKREWIARSYGEAPEIDPVIYIQGRLLKDKETAAYGTWQTGQFIKVKITGSRGYDLEAVPIP